VNIRVAEWKDIESLVDIYNQAVELGQKTADLKPVTVNSRRQWFEDHKPDKYPILVAECNNIVRGYATISTYRPGRQALRFTAEISFYVHFDYHRQGVASRLLQYAIDICPSLQIKTLFAILMDRNTASIRLLEKYGFEKWGHMPRVAEFDEVEVGHLYYGLKIEMLC
jgi:L-amino acid N-acyltransferase YncA